ncbi:MAG: hypothetical protein WCS15_04625 [Prevotella sp.]
MITQLIFDSDKDGDDFEMQCAIKGKQYLMTLSDIWRKIYALKHSPKDSFTREEMFDAFNECCNDNDVNVERDMR